MIKTDKHAGASLKDIRAKEKAAQEETLRAKCAAIANERFGEDQLKKWSNEHKGLWFLPVMDETGEKIEMLGIMQPINRHILSYASTKITDEGLYAFLESCMRECWVDGDSAILDDDDYFIPAAMKFNSILEGKKAALLKR
jgi:hypothetical protein